MESRLSFSDLAKEKNVWVITGRAKKTKKKKAGTVKFFKENFVGIRIKAATSPNLSWVECFLNKDIANGTIVILARDENASAEGKTVQAV